MTDAILTLNAGSSSIKFALFARQVPVPERPELSGQIDGLGARPHLKANDASGRPLEDIDLQLPAEGQHRAALEFLTNWLHEHEAGWQIVGVGHRMVHGAQRFSRPMILDPGTVEILKGFIPLAPLHQPHNLAGVEAITAALPSIPQVACFDTAFHRTQPEVAQRFALPRRITAQGEIGRASCRERV